MGGGAQRRATSAPACEPSSSNLRSDPGASSRRDKSRVADSRAIPIRIAQFTERLCVSHVRHVADDRGRFVTSKAEDYRRRARACLLMAGTIADDSTRAALVEMAQVWTRLADEDAAGARPDTIAESPPVMQQQQQIQSKKKEK